MFPLGSAILHKREVESLPSGIGGIILKGIGGFYYVESAEGIYECKARGIFRKTGIAPLPGDRVVFSVVDEAKRTGSIDEILPRNNLLTRPAVANADQLIVVVSVKSPDPELFLVDKLLVEAEKNGMAAVICVNKIDLDTENEHMRIVEAYSGAGYNIFSASLKTGEGLENVREVLNGKVSVLAGQSGVGKSTMLNRIAGAWVMETGDVSKKTERGRHTTRHAELIKLDSGGYVADTPGFSALELPDVSHDELEAFYPDFNAYRKKCRFSGCSHVSEPDCGVKEAAESRLIDPGRYCRYVRLYNILKQNADCKNKYGVRKK